MAILTFLVLVVVLLILACMVLMAIDLRAIRSELLPDIRKKLLQDGCSADAGGLPQITYPNSNCHANNSGSFVTWQWSAGQGQPLSSPLRQGAMLGAPPAYPGAYEGDCAKTWVSDPEQ